MDKRFIFLGPPGAGKGTQASRLSEELKIPSIATGSIFRQAMSEASTLGKQIAQFVNSGLLVPDELTNAIVRERLKKPDCKAGYILDGYPRSLPQAKALDADLKKLETPISAVLYFQVDSAQVVQRMSQRRICGQCSQPYNLISQPPKVKGVCDRCQGALIERADDQPEAIKKRLVVYEETTSPLLAFYKKKEILHMINATASVDDVYQEVKKICLGQA